MHLSQVICILIPVFLYVPVITGQEVGCFEPGECQLALVLDDKAGVQNAEDCYLNYKYYVDQCQYFTYNTDLTVCFSYSNCPVYNPDRNDATSGKTDSVCFLGLYAHFLASVRDY